MQARNTALGDEWPPVPTCFASASPPDAELRISPMQGPKALRGLLDSLSRASTLAPLRKLKSALGFKKGGQRSKVLGPPSANASAHACSAHGGFLHWRGNSSTPDPTISPTLGHISSATDIQLQVPQTQGGGVAVPMRSGAAPSTRLLLKAATLAAATGVLGSPVTASSPVACATCALAVNAGPREQCAVASLQPALSAPDRSLYNSGYGGDGGSSAQSPSPVPHELEVCLSAPPNLAESLSATVHATVSARAELVSGGHQVVGMSNKPPPAGASRGARPEGSVHGCPMVNASWKAEHVDAAAAAAAGDGDPGCAPDVQADAARCRHVLAPNQQQQQQALQQLPGITASPLPLQPSPDYPQAQLRARRSIETGTLLAMARTVPHGMWRATWRLEDYAITRRIFKGSKTAVYKAICKRTALPVALKIYFLERIPANTLHQIAREIQIQVGLKQNNILGLYGAFQDSRHLVLVMELAGRGDLHRLHAAMDRPLGDEQLRCLVLEPLLDALAYLHARAICHRDIKPENLLFTADWSLRLADFGVAINLAEERAVTRAGTADYMAPEVERCPLKAAPSDNKNDASLAYTTAADVWSVGVLAYEMLTGVPPVLSRCGASAQGHAASPALRFPAFVSPAARDFITSALALRPEERPTVQELRAHPWMVGASAAPGGSGACQATVAGMGP